MKRLSRSPYDPIVVLLFPRWTTASVSILDMYPMLDHVDYAIALASDADEAQTIRKQWNGPDNLPLVLIRVGVAQSLQMAINAIIEISKVNQTSPIGVLVIDSPDVHEFTKKKRHVWNRHFAEGLHRNLLDLQIHEYSHTWTVCPPKVR